SLPDFVVPRSSNNDATVPAPQVIEGRIRTCVGQGQHPLDDGRGSREELCGQPSLAGVENELRVSAALRRLGPRTRRLLVVEEWVRRDRGPRDNSLSLSPAQVTEFTWSKPRIKGGSPSSFRSTRRPRFTTISGSRQAGSCPPGPFQRGRLWTAASDVSHSR